MPTAEEVFAFETVVEDERVDCLDRQRFIEQLIDVVEALSENKKSACYAINGEWGSGKSFVLDKFEKQIARIGQEGTTLDKYIVFHYNCWQYDFYEEPLIALVAAVLEQLKEHPQISASDGYGDKLNKVAAGLQLAGLCVWGITKNRIKDKTGFDPEDLYSLFKNTKEVSADFINNRHKFDIYFDFKKILKSISDLFEQLAKDQTIIFVVDELDRCLPEYAIKVLERLHHIFEDIPNIQVILAVDKQQLENTVRQIYGDKVSVEQYLEKFINFELKLEVGEVSEKMMNEVYKDYFQSFSFAQTSADDVDEICKMLLNSIDVRKCKVIIEKSFLCHRLLNPGSGLRDGIYLCVELFLTLLSQFDIKSGIYLHLDSLISSRRDFSAPNGLILLNNKFHDESIGGEEYIHSDSHSTTYVCTSDIYGVLLGCDRVLSGINNDHWYSNSSHVYCNKEAIASYAIRFKDFLKILN